MRLRNLEGSHARFSLLWLLTVRIGLRGSQAVPPCWRAQASESASSAGEDVTNVGAGAPPPPRAAPGHALVTPTVPFRPIRHSCASQCGRGRKRWDGRTPSGRSRQRGDVTRVRRTCRTPTPAASLPVQRVRAGRVGDREAASSPPHCRCARGGPAVRRMKLEWSEA